MKYEKECYYVFFALDTYNRVVCRDGGIYAERIHCRAKGMEQREMP